MIGPIHRIIIHRRLQSRLMRRIISDSESVDSDHRTQQLQPTRLVPVPLPRLRTFIHTSPQRSHEIFFQKFRLFPTAPAPVGLMRPIIFGSESVDSDHRTQQLHPRDSFQSRCRGSERSSTHLHSAVRKFFSKNSDFFQPHRLQSDSCGLSFSAASPTTPITVPNKFMNRTGSSQTHAAYHFRQRVRRLRSPYPTNS
jgi:hypothetical protein